MGTREFDVSVILSLEFRRKTCTCRYRGWDLFHVPTWRDFNAITRITLSLAVEIETRRAALVLMTRLFGYCGVIARISGTH